MFTQSVAGQEASSSPLLLKDLSVHKIPSLCFVDINTGNHTAALHVYIYLLFVLALSLFVLKSSEVDRIEETREETASGQIYTHRYLHCAAKKNAPIHTSGFGADQDI